ncbi:ATP-dependent DNA helicase PIF1-like protein [Tanacetum coccineum]
MEAEHASLYSKITDEKREVYNTIIEATDSEKGAFFSCMVMEEQVKLLCGKHSSNILIQEELNFKKNEMEAEHASLYSKITDEKREVYNTIIEAIDSGKGGVFFLYGYGGTADSPLAALLRKTKLIIWDEAPKGTREQIVDALLNHSYIWEHCTVLKLTTNMRLKSTNNKKDTKEIKEFADWMLKTGEGEVGPANDGEVEIEFLDDVSLKHMEIH